MEPSSVKRKLAVILAAAITPLLSACQSDALLVRTEQTVEIKYTRQELEEKWRTRLISFLDKDVIPLIDLQSSIKREDGERYLDEALEVMDELGLALIAFDGRQAPKEGKTKGYRWGYYIHEIVNAHPDRFILATNGGTSRNWARQKGGRPEDFVDQLEKHVLSGDYPIMGELEFRHYMSKRQCREGKYHRDTDVPLNSNNGHRVFRLSQETGVPFVIHLEPEDKPLDALEEMLRTYPDAKVIVAHFGQIRHPEREKRFGPDLVRRLFIAYPNLLYDISTGHPNRRYTCDGDVLDTVIWQDREGDGQKDVLKPEYKALLTEFSTRFVAGIDYGGGRPPLPKHLRRNVGKLRLILRDLPDKAKHNIGYRNAWKLLTGKDWSAFGGSNQHTALGTSTPEAVSESRVTLYYTGVISDGHGHLAGRKADPDALIMAMDRNTIDKVVIWVKSKGGWTDDATLEFHGRYPNRVVPGIAFQNSGWRNQRPGFMEEVRRKVASRQFSWLGEVSLRGKIGGRLNARPDSALLHEVLEISVKFSLPVTIHHNPYEKTSGTYRRTAEYQQFIKTLTQNRDSAVVWAHWCGLSSAADVRTLLERFPNLHCDLAWLHKPQHLLPNPLVDENHRFLPSWKTLIEDFPDRFIVGIDTVPTPRNLEDYDSRVMKIRTALGGLRSEVARKVATENFHRLAKMK